MTTPSRFTDHSLVGIVVGCFVVPVVVPLHPPSAEYTHQQEIGLQLPNTHDITSFDMEICKYKLQNSYNVGRQEEEIVASNIQRHSAMMKLFFNIAYCNKLNILNF